MTLADEALADQESEDTSELRARLLKVRRELSTVKASEKAATGRLESLEGLLDRYVEISADDAKVPTWLTPKRKSKAHRATPLLQLSDLHLDEVVDLDEMGGMNEFNRVIAHRRFERVIEGTVKMATTYVSGVHFDGIVVCLNGDILTGDIHQELALTNEAPWPASVVHWVPELCAGLVHLADTFERVQVFCTDGNHDRDPNKKRTPTKKRAESSIAWIIYNSMADHLRADPRITFTISKAPSVVYDIYGTRFRQSHGDGFKSQGGVGGIFPSLLKWLHRMDSAQSRTGGGVIDYHLFGHHHQYLTGPNWVANGSLKGYDEYAVDKGFSFELPRQALSIVTPERGIVQQMPVYGD